MHVRIYFILIMFSQLPHVSFGQDNPTIFYEVVKDDSLMLFFNERNKFIEKKCADFTRYIRMDPEGNFNGYYEDLSNENTLRSKGRYVHGKKHGYFEIYYPNGKINCKGNYSNNVPVGQWEYFHDNELPERTITISESGIALTRFVDKKGNLKVIDGKGEFNGLVAGNSVGSTSIIAKGKIEKGKPNGKWTSTVFNNVTYCKEEFDQGKLVRGVFPNAMLGGDEEYHDKPYLNTFFLVSYLNSLEEFKLEKCADSAKYVSKPYSFDVQRFNSDLRIKIDKVIEQDFKTGKSGDYLIGDNYLTIQFSVNNDGKPVDFVMLSGWGQQFYNTILSSIKMQTRFPANVKDMFFHLKLHFPGGFTYQYSFQFSKNSTYH
jgi:hypothetical protein